MLQFCSGLMKSEMFTNEKYTQYLMDFDISKKDEYYNFITKLIPDATSINISNELIVTLEKEFELFKIKESKIMK